MALNRIQIEPIKYLTKLPTFDGNFCDLYTFIDLVDRVGFVLETYDDVSQRIFLDIIKSKLIGNAKDVAEINNNLTSWTELKEALTNNFGDRLSSEQLYDLMRSLKFKNTAKQFFDEIITVLKRLNMKTRIDNQNDQNYDALIVANKRTALNVFKNKLPEPMKSIIICRNPDNIENAMKILHGCNYAFYNPNPQMQNQNREIRNTNFQNKNQNQNSNNIQPNENYRNRNNAIQNQDHSYNPYQNQYNSYEQQPNSNQNHLNTNTYQQNNRNFYNVTRNTNDRPVPMEIGNFQQDHTTSLPT